MPVLPTPVFSPPFYQFNKHLQTILPSMLRKVSGVNYTRERISTPDRDFLDLDWLVIGSKQLLIVSHGLEGDAHRPYVKGMVKAAHNAGMDALAWNYRSCSGEPNQLLSSYHLGATQDLDLVIRYALKQKKYETVYLTGFSAGGNITLKYLGEAPEKVPAEVKRAAVFSVPCHLKSSALQISRPENRIYLRRFLNSLRLKLEQKIPIANGTLDLSDYHLVRDFQAFDDRFTAPLHGFANADDYYAQCSSLAYLPSIQIPTLLVNAQNDPFLSPQCFPVKEAEENPNLFLEMPKNGGHVGFALDFAKGIYYSEQRAMQFLTAEVPA
ncbi:alpha/beta fold hydrolase [Adhaeribacter sp. BT258]|uniref:Alpha/beta fold hydrolase n=1 Tax=Adhaeribacter terrigena TaxID=2793070 RepID=A0ABS1C6A3_9BACT|nr:alpha/beta fold hydrolase [Adhaeribacter terrigena]MBK0404908.1 alpha/beta fold hydrolase [Adhaeribacter terrigena]